jgi:prophage antirepressor-like protein
MQLQIFKYEEDREHLNDLTIIEIDGEVWFVASEVCALLDIKNVSDAVGRLDEDEKNTIAITEGIRGNPNKTIISESGLYSLIFRSTKPFAKTFRRWVTREVIPAIRKTGAYGLAPNFVRRFNDNWDRTAKGHFFSY